MTMTAQIGRFSGIHVIVEFEDADPALLDDESLLRTLLPRAMKESGATVMEVVSHRFVPQGVTVLTLLAESHASMHTYPQHRAAFVDVFTCGDRADPRKAVSVLAAELSPGRVTTRIIGRGGQRVEVPL
ncbi:adenosylmethionine decarboxylase [Herbidospora sp. RD11066]